MTMGYLKEHKHKKHEDIVAIYSYKGITILVPLSEGTRFIYGKTTCTLYDYRDGE